MPDLSKIKLPDNTEVSIKDHRISGIDSTPTSGSDNLVTSGGVYDAVSAKYTKPSGGIPASDLASGVIPSVQSLTTSEIDAIWDNA